MSVQEPLIEANSSSAPYRPWLRWVCALSGHWWSKKYFATRHLQIKRNPVCALCGCFVKLEPEGSTSSPDNAVPKTVVDQKRMPVPDIHELNVHFDFWYPLHSGEKSELLYGDCGLKVGDILRLRPIALTNGHDDNDDSFVYLEGELTRLITGIVPQQRPGLVLLKLAKVS